MSLKRSILAAFLPLLLVSMLVAACGNSSTATTPTATTAPTTAPTAAPAPVVKTASVTVKGKSETILTDAQGKTLYYFTKDTATTSNCTAACAQAWPPLIFSGTGTPTSDASLPGTLSVVTTTNGMMVAYQGHLLYLFSGDSAAGQTNGDGLHGFWFIATTDLKAASASQYGTGGY